MEEPVNPYASPQAVIADLPGSGAELASRGARLMAQFIDGLILIVPAVLIGIVAAFLIPALHIARDGPPSGLGLMVLQLTIGPALFVALNYGLLSREGQTIGKRAAGVRIVRSDGSRAGVGHLLLRRYLPVAVLGAIPVVNVLTGIDALCIFRSSRKCIHDDIADTIVVKA